MTIQRAAKRAGRRAKVRREQVLDAALKLADEGGLEAVTMRSLGQQLGVEAMSLYRHVRNKEEVVDGIVDLVFAEIDVPQADAGWKSAMRQLAISARAALARHPWAIGLMESRARPGPANLRHHDAVLAVLLGAGFSAATATRAYNLVDSYVYGFALQEASLPVSTPEKMAGVGAEILEHMPTAEYPHLARVGAELMAAGFDFGAEFEIGLDLILDSVERIVAA